MNPSVLFSDVHPVVMLCRNAVELTKRAVESVLAQTIPTVVRAVDNASTDGTDEYLLSRLPRVTSQRFIPQLGVSAAWNYALADVFRTWDHCLVINNDVELIAGTYDALLADGGLFVTAVSVGNVEQLDWDGLARKRNHPDFSCFLIRREVWQKIGGFDESMVLYASDADYHLRMHQAGIEAYTIGVPFYHYASGTLKNSTFVERRRIEIQADKDRARFEEKWGCRVGSDEYYKLFGNGRPE